MKKYKADVKIDGRKLEGGGQLLRVALCLSALTGQSIRINNIRGSRSGQRGLKNQHLACVQSLAAACDAYTVGARVGSSDLLFAPGQGDGKSAKKQDVTILHDGEEVVAREMVIQPATPGAVTLILQAVLPYLLFNKQASPVVLVLKGATHTTSSPSSDYIESILLPNLRAFGLPTKSVHILGQAPYTTQRAQRSFGQLTLLIRPIKERFLPLDVPDSTAPSVEVSEQGLSQDSLMDLEIHAHILFDTASEKAACIDHICDILQQSLRDCDILGRYKPLRVSSTATDASVVDVREILAGDSMNPSNHPASALRSGSHTFYLLLVANSSDGTAIGADSRHTFKYNPGAQEQTLSVNEACGELAQSAVNALEQELATAREHGIHMDSHMRDQAVVFLGLLGGRLMNRTLRDSEDSQTDAESHHGLTLHAQTAMWMTKLMLGVEFDADGAGVHEGWLAQDSKNPQKLTTANLAAALPDIGEK